MFVDFLLERFGQRPDEEAFVWSGKSFSYGWLLKRVVHWSAELEKNGVSKDSVVGLAAGFSPNSVALFLALIERRCVTVPLTGAAAGKRGDFLKIAQAQRLIELDAKDEACFSKLPHKPDHALYSELRRRKHPGLILFTSGSTGQSKAVLHDLVGILEKFHTPRQRLRAISFLLYDHIGGVNTLLYQLSNAGCVIMLEDHRPETVLSAVARHRAELLPASPTFLSLALLSEAARRHDLSSLKVVTYGTEPMPEALLKRVHEALPGVKLQQTYGLSELGILRSKSRGSDSTWVKIGGEGFETRVLDGLLQIKARSAMLGYLNAESPFTDDGWFITGDAVEVDGEWLRILGRRSEMINVGGQKLFPAEVESVLEQFPGVVEARVFGEASPLTGQIVCADVSAEPADEKEFSRELKRFCRARLEPYKVPVKIVLRRSALHNERFKKVRRREPA